MCVHGLCYVIIIIIIYLICRKTGWHQKAKPVRGCFPNIQYKKKQ